MHILTYFCVQNANEAHRVAFQSCTWLKTSSYPNRTIWIFVISPFGPNHSSGKHNSISHSKRIALYQNVKKAATSDCSTSSSASKALQKNLKFKLILKPLRLVVDMMVLFIQKGRQWTAPCSKTTPLFSEDDIDDDVKYIRRVSLDRLEHKKTLNAHSRELWLAG